MDYNIFHNYTIYPNVENIFGLSLLPLEKIKNDCIFVLDTNTLLVPYSTGSESLAAIEKVYERVKKQDRLKIPGQVAREFANHRPEKLKVIFQNLTRKITSIQNQTIGNYPLLEGIDCYKKAIQFEKEINKKLDEYREGIKTLAAEVRSWNWDDPVSQLYRRIFTKETILDIPIDEEKIKKDLEYRYAHKMPPGFKDGNLRNIRMIRPFISLNCPSFCNFLGLIRMR